MGSPCHNLKGNHATIILLLTQERIIAIPNITGDEDACGQGDDYKILDKAPLSGRKPYCMSTSIGT